VAPYKMGLLIKSVTSSANSQLSDYRHANTENFHCQIKVC